MRGSASARAVWSGFGDPVVDGQKMFRTLLDVMAHPGRVRVLPLAVEAPAPLSSGAAAVCLTLLDMDTPLWLDPGLLASPSVADYVRLHCGCPLTAMPERARFAVISEAGSMPSFGSFRQGEPENPEHSATLVIQVADMDDVDGEGLRGPGIADCRRLWLGGVPQCFWEDVRRNRARFPCGVDVICVSDTKVVGLPRTVEVGG